MVIGGLNRDDVTGHGGVDHLFGGPGDDILNVGDTWVGVYTIDNVSCGTGYDVVENYAPGVDTIASDCEELKPPEELGVE